MLAAKLDAAEALRLVNEENEAKARVAALGLLLRHAAFIGSNKVKPLLGPLRGANPDTPDSVSRIC